MTSEASLDERASRSLSRALSFLEGAQLDSGEFRVTTSLSPDMSGECKADPAIFPTALVAHCLAFAPAQAQPMRDRAIAFLLEQRDRHGLWRHWTRDHPYFDQLPPDLDDTCCVSAVLASTVPQAVADRALLLANRDGRGRFLTWIAPRPGWRGWAFARATLPQLARAPALIMFFRKTSAALGDVDAVVNANCLHFLGAFAGRDRVVEWLVDILRRSDEAEVDKWYRNPFVVRYFLSRALVSLTPAAIPLLQRRATTVEPRGALEIALTICVLLDCAGSAPDRLVDALLATQRPEGGWPTAAVYYGGSARRPDGRLMSPRPGTPHWGSEELTTGFAVEALSRWRAGRRPHPA